MSDTEWVQVKRESLEAFTAAVDAFLAELDTDTLDDETGLPDWDEIPPRPTDGARVIDATRVREE